MIPHTVLAIDDSTDDLLQLRRAFTKVAPEVTLQTAENGVEALSYLYGTGKFADRKLFPLPRWILLDMKMPDLDGAEVLEQLREIKSTVRMTVVVFSSARSPQDVVKAETLGADFFEIKPTSFDELCGFVDRFVEYFSEVGKT